MSLIPTLVTNWSSTAACRQNIDHKKINLNTNMTSYGHSRLKAIGRHSRGGTMVARTMVDRGVTMVARTMVDRGVTMEDRTMVARRGTMIARRGTMVARRRDNVR